MGVGGLGKVPFIVPALLFRLALPAVFVGGKVEQAGQSHILNQTF